VATANHDIDPQATHRLLAHPANGQDDYDVLADGVVVGRIMKAAASPEGTPWMRTLAFGYHEDRTPTHGYAATREAAMAAFAKSWRRGCQLHYGGRSKTGAMRRQNHKDTLLRPPQAQNLG
jgi:hypothetical protein